MTRRRARLAAPTFNVARAVDDLRQTIARADALVRATEELLESGTWGDDQDEDDDGRRLERLSHLLGAAVEAVRAAVHAGDQIAADLVKHRVGS